MQRLSQGGPFRGEAEPHLPARSRRRSRQGWQGHGARGAGCSQLADEVRPQRGEGRYGLGTIYDTVSYLRYGLGTVGLDPAGSDQ